MKMHHDSDNTYDITKKIINEQDKEYRDFSSKLIVNISKDEIIGVRTPVLRKIAKDIHSTKQADEFLSSLPHSYLEENHLHAFLIEYEKDFDKAIKLTTEFLPYINNWATCDSFRPKVFKKHTDRLFEYIKLFLKSEHTYTIRYGIGLLLSFYLDEEFSTSHLAMVADINSDEYYINMMRAWYFATAIAKQRNYTLPYIENKLLDVWTHNKTISKACESFRVDDNTKTYLKTLKISVRR